MSWNKLIGISYSFTKFSICSSFQFHKLCLKQVKIIFDLQLNKLCGCCNRRKNVCVSNQAKNGTNKFMRHFLHDFFTIIFYMTFLQSFSTCWLQIVSPFILYATFKPFFPLGIAHFVESHFIESHKIDQNYYKQSVCWKSWLGQS